MRFKQLMKKRFKHDGGNDDGNKSLNSRQTSPFTTHINFSFQFKPAN